MWAQSVAEVEEFCISDTKCRRKSISLTLQDFHFLGEPRNVWKVFRQGEAVERKASHVQTYIEDMIGAAKHIIIKIIVWRDGTLSLDTF